MPTLHLYLDESGDLTFSPVGTKHYVFAVAWTLDPLPVVNDLASLRFDLLKQGYDLPSFHAAPDKQVHRNAVVDVLLQHDNWRFAAIVVEKSKVNPALREPRIFYPKFASMVLRFVLRERCRRGAQSGGERPACRPDAGLASGVRLGTHGSAAGAQRAGSFAFHCPMSDSPRCRMAECRSGSSCSRLLLRSSRRCSRGWSRVL